MVIPTEGKNLCNFSIFHTNYFKGFPIETFLIYCHIFAFHFWKLGLGMFYLSYFSRVILCSFFLSDFQKRFALEIIFGMNSLEDLANSNSNSRVYVSTH